jgi:hypothetical protein
LRAKPVAASPLNIGGPLHAADGTLSIMPGDRFKKKAQPLLSDLGKTVRIREVAEGPGSALYALTQENLGCQKRAGAAR